VTETAGGAGQQERVDDLRQQLRALGYLDAGVDRFLLAPARASGNPFGVAVKSGIRVGVLAGAMLGPAAAIGVGARIPGLISGPRDALVLALYFAALFTIVFAAAAAVVGMPAFLLARRRGGRTTARAGRISTASGLLVGIGCLAYLTLWWRTASGGIEWQSPLLTAFALLLAVAISFTLGHAVRITTLGVIATAAASDSLPAPPRRSWRLATAGAALAFVGAAALLVVTTSAEPSPDVAPPHLTVLSTGLRIRVIAIDGVDPQLFDLGRWLGPADYIDYTQYRLAPEDTSDPARIWTTIATGEPPSVHGVQAIETRRIAGLRGILSPDRSSAGRALAGATDLVRLTRPSAASRDERQSMTFWEVAEHAGLRTAVVNWWATWPAPASSGILVTDRAVLRLEHGGAQDAEIAPPELYPALAAEWPAIRAAAARASNAFHGITDPAVADALRRSAMLDATIVGLSDAIPGPARDLDVVYLPGLDILQHTILASHDGIPLAPSAVTARVSALQAYKQFLRPLLDPWLHPSPRSMVILVTEPGRVSGKLPGTVAISGGPGNFGHGTIPGETASVLDLAPTVLHLLGVPLSRDLAPPLSTHVVVARVPAPVPSYGRPFRGAAPRSGKPLDQEMIDRLRSLGYVR
jgi:hypothetical protein